MSGACRNRVCLVVFLLSARGTSAEPNVTAPCCDAAHCDCERATPIDIERGQPRKVVDGIGWFFGIPSKVLLWNRRADNHHVSPHTQNALVEYMAANGLVSTKVRINQYRPFDDWRRLRKNKRVGAGWRYTVGTLHTLGDTIFPGRIFGGDHYNPYTDTVHVYSDIPSLALEQSAYAKDVHHRPHPGTYAAVHGLPLVRLGRERRNKNDVLSYVDRYGTIQERIEARHTLQPQFGSEVGGDIGQLLPQVQPLVKLTGAIVGHAVGRTQGHRIAKAPFVNNATYQSATGPQDEINQQE